MSNAILQFKTLSSLADYYKKMNLEVYIINTLNLTLVAALSEFQINIALEEFEAILMNEPAIAM